MAIRNDFYVYCVSVFRSQWFNILNRVHRATEEELHGMREESANVKHAVVRRLTLSQFSQEILFNTNVAISRRSVSWNAVQKASERKNGEERDLGRRSFLAPSPSLLFAPPFFWPGPNELKYLGPPGRGLLTWH